MRDRRIKAGISLRQTAKKMGVSAPYLSDLELGRRQITEKAEAAFLVATTKAAPESPTMKDKLIEALLAPTIQTMRRAGIARLSIDGHAAVLQMDTGEVLSLTSTNPDAEVPVSPRGDPVYMETKEGFRPGDSVQFGGDIYEVAELKKFPHGWMVGIYDEPPSRHIDYLNPKSLLRKGRYGD